MSRTTHLAAILTGALLGAGVHHFGTMPDIESCGGDAPPDYACTTGTHTLLGQLKMTVFGASAYNGTIRSTAWWTSHGERQEYVVLCDYKPKECRTEGTPPLVGREFTHDCTSSTYKTSLPGGTGSWLCVLQH